MKRILFIVACVSFISMPSIAKIKIIPYTQNYTENTPVISKSECENYFSEEHEFLKNKNYEVAYEKWMAVFTTCPDIQRQLYSDGARILEQLYANAGDNESEKIRIGDIVMQMYDKRIEYFGADERYPASYVLSLKALDYKKYFESTKAYSRDTVYTWLHEAMSHHQCAPDLKALELLFDLSCENYNAHKSNQNIIELLYEDYCNVMAGLNIVIYDSTSTKRDMAKQMKEQIIRKDVFRDQNCENYIPTTKTSNVKQETSASKAKSCLKNKNYTDAIFHFKRAIVECSSINEQADYLYLIAQCYQTLRDYPMAVEYAKKSLALKPDQGRCYLIMGYCYASAKLFSGDTVREKILNKSVYWVACDMFAKAKEDPSTQDKAERNIATYSKYFPTAEERSNLRDDFKGDTFFVGGWINVTTRIR